jgi:hypothetical protein
MWDGIERLRQIQNGDVSLDIVVEIPSEVVDGYCELSFTRITATESMVQRSEYLVFL